MLAKSRITCASLLVVGLLQVSLALPASAADGMPWRVGKASGQVWTVTSGAQNAALTQDIELKPGDSIRTGPTGRVLLTRGEETILISPNSAVSVPTDQKQDGLSTTIIEQAGSILVHAEKRNVKHFQVETPYLAAVVKGTHFRVDVTKTGSQVAVLEGRVEVSDFKTGQIALVLPGQAAHVQSFGNRGLTLSGSGKFNPIERGAPRTPSFDRIPVPKKGLAMPADAPGEKTVHALGRVDAIKNSFASADTGQGHNSLRITAPLGEVKLNFAKATNGLAHGAGALGAGNANAGRQTGGDDGGSNGNGAAKLATQESAGGSGGGAGGLGAGGGVSGAVGGAVGSVGGAVGGVVGGLTGNGNGNGLALGNTVNALTNDAVGAGGNGKALGIVLGRARALGRL